MIHFLQESGGYLATGCLVPLGYLGYVGWANWHDAHDLPLRRVTRSGKGARR